MSKQAWRFVLKKKDTKTQKEHRERETKRREEKVRGTAQELFSHEAQQKQNTTTKIMPVTT